MEQNIVKSTTGVITNILDLARLGDSKMWIDYDREVRNNKSAFDKI